MKTTRDENPNQIEIDERIANRKPAISTAQPPELVALNKALIEASISKSTRAAYARDWKAFIEWARSAGVQPIPASDKTIAAYVTYLVSLGRKPATIDRAMTTIAKAHRLLDFESPTRGSVVEATRKGHKRTVGTAQKRARPLTLDHVVRVLSALQRLPGPRRHRDRALVALGWAGALRRAELAAVRCEDLTEQAAGLVLRLPRSKTDQSGAGEYVGIPFGAVFCPVSLVREWQAAAGIDSGPLFRSLRKGGRINDRGIDGRAVDRIVAEAAELAGYSERYSGHSLRAGMITSSATDGIADRVVMTHTRHRSARVFAGYVRPASVFQNNPVQVLLGSIPDPNDQDRPAAGEL